MPAAEKVAVVSTAFGLPKVTVPGPLTLLQVGVVAPGGLGRPSSVTVPSRLAEAGSVTVWSAPADTEGGALVCEGGFTTTVRSSFAVRAESVTLSRST